jgi:hypothetical protein
MRLIARALAFLGLAGAFGMSKPANTTPITPMDRDGAMITQSVTQPTAPKRQMSRKEWKKRQRARNQQEASRRINRK